MISHLLLIVISTLHFGLVSPNDTKENVEIFNKAMEKLSPYKELSYNELVTKTAIYFLNTPYTASTIESSPEKLIVNLRETDCILFVEMCIAISQTIKGDQSHFSDFCENVRKLRYRDGIIDGYDSRLHYTSEWILQNSKRGVFYEVSQSFGVERKQIFSFMSDHPMNYKAMQNDPEMVTKIKEREISLNNAAPFYYIPQKKIASIKKQIINGDIICFVTDVPGLDISHLGIAYWRGGELYFIHASSKEKKVVIETRRLEEYAKKGIRLLKFR